MTTLALCIAGWVWFAGFAVVTSVRGAHKKRNEKTELALFIGVLWPFVFVYRLICLVFTFTALGPRR